MYGGVQVDHVRRAALAVQVGREALRGHEMASGPPRRGRTRQRPPQPLTCTKVVFPEPAIPSTNTHTGAAAAAADSPAAAIFPGTTFAFPGRDPQLPAIGRKLSMIG